MPVCRPEPDQRLSFSALASLQPAGARTRSGAVLQCAGEGSASRCFAVLQALTTLTEQSNMALCVESLPVSRGESTHGGQWASLLCHPAIRFSMVDCTHQPLVALCILCPETPGALPLYSTPHAREYGVGVGVLHVSPARYLYTFCRPPCRCEFPSLSSVSYLTYRCLPLLCIEGKPSADTEFLVYNSNLSLVIPDAAQIGLSVEPSAELHHWVTVSHAELCSHRADI